MKGWLFDENLPVQLRFSPKLPLFPPLKLAGIRVIRRFGNLPGAMIW
jgi:hypothetical protein